MTQRKLGKTLALLPLAAACFGASVHAQNITFTGTVNAASCTATITGGTNPTILIPPVSQQQIPSVGSVGGGTTFTVNLAACGSGATQLAKIYFYNATPGAVASGRLVAPAPAAGWAIEMISGAAGASTQIPFGTNATPVNNPGDPGVSITSGTGTLQYHVRYVRTATTLVPGTANMTANYVVHYV